MEDGLRDYVIEYKYSYCDGLNPCFNGRWSARKIKKNLQKSLQLSLNPCFNGRWSARAKGKDTSVEEVEVLILVLMEDGLREKLKKTFKKVCS